MNALILAGGLGTRLRPLTDETPKSLLPIANRPFLEHQIDHLRSHGVERVVLSLGHLPEAIRAHFGDRCEYVVEPEPLGTGGAIRFAGAGFGETFLVCNGDVLTDLDLTGLVAFHRERGSRATIALTPVDDPSRYGLVLTEEGRGAVTAFVEKPAPGTVEPPARINAGTYVLEPDVLDLIEPGRQVSIEHDVFPRLVGAGLFALASDARWRDIGTPESYLAANLERMPAGGLIDPSARLDPGASVERSVVGPGAVIGAGARVRESVLLEGAAVAPNTVLDRRVVGADGQPVW